MPNSNDFNRFESVPNDVDIGRSVFDLSHTHKFSFNCGDLIPHFWQFCLPGDTFEMDTTKVIRLQPMVAPIMDDLYCDNYYFFVPMRLVWQHWQNFCGENTTSPWAPNIEYEIPTTRPPSNGWNPGTIADYIGVPPNVAPPSSSSSNPDLININSLVFRAYALICNEWFRDENLMTPVHVSTGDSVTLGSNGSDQVTDIEKGGKPFIVAKYHDYFTSCHSKTAN